MATLEQLASREDWCGTEIGRIRATNPYLVLPGNRSATYDPIIHEWREIHAAYLQIAKANLADAREALKRALFIQWYEVAEPFFLTGILDLDGTLKAHVLTHTEKGLRDDDDVELKEMVAWYGAIADNAFDPSSTGPLLRHFCARALTSHGLPPTTNATGIPVAD